MTNTYGLKMQGLRKAAGLTKDLDGHYSGQYYQLSYNRSTGEILMAYHCDRGQNSWTEYHDSNIVTIANISEPATMQDLADKINEWNLTRGI